MKHNVQSKTGKLFALFARLALAVSMLIFPRAAQASTTVPAADPPQLALDMEWTSISAGVYHTCGLTPAGEVLCWGANRFGQLGNGLFESSFLPPPPVDLPGAASAISAGDDHSCAVVDGAAYCWGYNNSGQLGDGTHNNSHTPLAVYGLPSGVSALAAGTSHTCALTQAGAVYCWGEGGSGQLGNGSYADKPGATEVTGLTAVVAIAAGDNHTCALTGAGGLFCWGKNGDGQLGNGENVSQPTPIQVTGLTSGVSAVAAGSLHTCALAGGKVLCWGANGFGQLGQGSNEASNVPKEVTGLSGANHLSAGGQHTCASTSSAAFCWGENTSGQVGDGTLENRLAPVEVIGLPAGSTPLSLGQQHSCALIGGSGYCWGSNDASQLGDGQLNQRSLPTDVLGLSSETTDLSTGSNHTCAVVGGQVKCWGYNVSGGLGNGTTNDSNVPVQVVGLPGGATVVAAGMDFSCAAAGGVWCWGTNEYRQLGGGVNTSISLTPVSIVELTSGVESLRAGAFHACALTLAGGVKCWGYNMDGRLGDGTFSQYKKPVDVTGLTSGVAAIAVGSDHSCALTDAGGVWCWGDNWTGQLGDGTNMTRSTPVQVTGLSSGVISLSAGYAHTCALTSSNQVFCWGYNKYGQLGDGSKTTHLSPVEATGLPEDMSTLAAGSEHTCALTSGGGIFCWGRNQAGQLGDGSVDDSLTPVSVSGLSSGAGAISANLNTTCALTVHGAAKCWGTGYRLGVDRVLFHAAPVKVVAASPAKLTLNYPDGRPGSFFTLTGWGFPPDTQAALSINGLQITNDLAINPTGSLIVFLDAASVPEGEYTVSLSAAPGAMVSFSVDASAPLRLQQGGGLALTLPSEWPEPPNDSLLFLPVLHR